MGENEIRCKSLIRQDGRNMYYLFPLSTGKYVIKKGVCSHLTLNFVIEMAGLLLLIVAVSLPCGVREMCSIKKMLGFKF